jgi:hypothetical protein
MAMYIGSILFSILCISALGRFIKSLVLHQQAPFPKSRGILEWLVILQRRNEDMDPCDLKKISSYTLFLLLLLLFIGVTLFL